MGTMTRRIQRQREAFAYRVASDVPGYPREYGKTEWTPEKDALANELGERLKLKGISGELTAENMTAALQELILMQRERDETPWSEDYDKSFNDWEAGDDKTARRIAAKALMAMPVPRSVPSNHITWEKQRGKLNEKAQKAGVPVELVPNFPMDINDFYDQSAQHERHLLRPVEYEGKGVPGGISHRYLEVGNGKIPVNYLLHHGDDGRINGILSHFPEGTPFEKPGSITVTVHPHHRDKGVGSALIRAAQDKFGIDLEQQEYTPLGYELYRNVKHQQGETVPNIFNEKVAAALDEPSLDSLQQSFRDFIIKRKPINPHTGQPHTPETAITDWLSGVVPFIQAVHPNLPYERYRYEPHTQGVNDLHDIPATIEKLIALHTREKYGNEMLLRRIRSDEIRQQSQTMTKDLENQFSKGYGVDNGKLVPMPPREYPRGADLERRLFQTQQPRQPFDTTPKPTPMPGGQPMPQRNPLPPMSDADAIRLEIQKARAASVTITAALECMAE